MKNKFKYVVVVLAILSVGCRAFAQTAKPLPESDRFKLAADYASQNKGVSVLVMKGDTIVFEDYQNGHTATEPWPIFSGTKSFSGVMCAAAIEDKLISGFDEKVSDTITEWKSHPQKSKITIRHLLSLSSGLDAGQIGVVPTYAEAVAKPAKFDPATHFEYGPVPFQVFGEIMTRKLTLKNETVMTYLHRRILDPIGLQVGFWRMEKGQPLLPQGANLTAREWVKFGLFLKNGGKWNGKQIIAKKLLDELVISSKTNPAYGLSFWLNHEGKNPMGVSTRNGGAGGEMIEGVADADKDLFMAAGAGNQRLYIIPSLDMVIVRQGAFGAWSDREFLSKLLLGK